MVQLFMNPKIGLELMVTASLVAASAGDDFLPCTELDGYHFRRDGVFDDSGLHAPRDTRYDDLRLVEHGFGWRHRRLPRLSFR